MEGKLRIGMSQLNANKASLNNSATWVVDKWFSKVGGRLAGWLAGRAACTRRRCCAHMVTMHACMHACSTKPITSAPPAIKCRAVLAGMPRLLLHCCSARQPALPTRQGSGLLCPLPSPHRRPAAPSLPLQADLVSSALASSSIPCFMIPTTYSIFRNQPAIDGGYAVGFKELCGGRPCVRVDSFYVGSQHADTKCHPEPPYNCKTPCWTAERKGRLTKLYNNTRLVDQWVLKNVETR